MIPSSGVCHGKWETTPWLLRKLFRMPQFRRKVVIWSNGMHSDMWEYHEGAK